MREKKKSFEFTNLSDLDDENTSGTGAIFKSWFRKNAKMFTSGTKWWIVKNVMIGMKRDWAIGCCRLCARTRERGWCDRSAGSAETRLSHGSRGRGPSRIQPRVVMAFFRPSTCVSLRRACSRSRPIAIARPTPCLDGATRALLS